MLQRKPKTLQLCWPEASLLVNYEADTLPLLFSTDEEYVAYYNAMGQLHSRKGRLMDQVRRLNTLARQEKEKGNPIGCVDYLAEACNVRCKMFAAGDYQITSAVEHCIWSQIHLATLLLTQGELSDAHRLFTAAAERIREVRPKPAAKTLPSVNGGTVVALPKRTINRLCLALNNNWSNYWARRGKWNAALQHTSKAKSLWETVVATAGGSGAVHLTHASHTRGGSQQHASTVSNKVPTKDGEGYISSFLACRVNVALCGTWDDANLRTASHLTSTNSSNSAHLTFAASGVPRSAMMEGTTFDRDGTAEGEEEEHSRSNSPQPRRDTDAPPPLAPFQRSPQKEKEPALPLDHLAAQGPGVTFRLVTIEVGGPNPNSTLEQESEEGQQHNNTSVVKNPSTVPSEDAVPFEVTLCLDSASTECCTTWPAHVTTLFIETYCSAFAGFALRKYDRVEKCLASCARIASKCAADCNSVWWKRVQGMYLLLQDAPGVDQASGFRMSKKDMMQKDFFGASKAVMDMVLQDKLQKRSATPAGTSSMGATLGHRPFSPLSTVGSQASLTGGADGAEDPEWSKLSRLFLRKVKPMDALKSIGNVEREVATPLQFARKRGHNHESPARPATVAGFVGESEEGDRYKLAHPERGVGTSTMAPSVDQVTPPSDFIVPEFVGIGAQSPPATAAAGAQRASVSSKRLHPNRRGTGKQGLSPKEKAQVAARDEAVLEKALKEFEYNENRSATRVRRQLDAALHAEKEREAHLEKAFETLQVALGQSRQRREELEQAKTERLANSPARIRRGDTTTSDVEPSMVDGIEISLLDIIEQEEAEQRKFAKDLAHLQEQRQETRNVRKAARRKEAQAAAPERKKSITFDGRPSSGGSSMLRRPGSGAGNRPSSGSTIKSASVISSGSPFGEGTTNTDGKKFKSGYKLNVDVDTTAEDAEGESKFNRNYNPTKQRTKSVMVTDQDTGIVSATKTIDLIPQVEGIIAKQKRLRSLLPAMDHRTETYRMVTKELSENEAILKLRRSEFSRQKLEKNAEKVAKKAGMVSVWRKLVEKKATDRRKSLGISQRGGRTNSSSHVLELEEQEAFDPSTWSAEEMKAAALTAATVISSATSLPTVAGGTPKKLLDETPTGTE